MKNTGSIILVLILLLLASICYILYSDIIPNWENKYREEGIIFWDSQVKSGIQQGVLPIIYNNSIQTVSLQDLCKGGEVEDDGL